MRQRHATRAHDVADSETGPGRPARSRRGEGRSRGFPGVAARTGFASGEMRVTPLEPVPKSLLLDCHASLTQADTAETGIERCRNVRPASGTDAGRTVLRIARPLI